MSRKVEAVLAKVRPYIQMHRGDVFLLAVEKGAVTLKVTGACANCSLAELTYNKMVAGILRQEVPGIKKINLEFE